MKCSMSFILVLLVFNKILMNEYYFPHTQSQITQLFPGNFLKRKLRTHKILNKRVLPTFLHFLTVT